MRVPIYEPKAEYLASRSAIDDAIRRVLESGVYTAGPEVAAFESELAEFCGVAHAVGVSSGSAALELSLAACGVGPGDEVITVPNTDMSTASAIIHAGARVVFADIEPDTLVIDPRLLERKLTKRTRALLPVHLFGQIADMDAVAAVAEKHALAVIEDATLAIGGRYRDKMAGTLGDAGCYSMNSRKILSAVGDAGAVLTESDELATTLRSLKDYGKRAKQDRGAILGEIEVLHAGFNARLDEIQAAILRVKLEALPASLERRRAIASRYTEAFSELNVSVPTPAAHVQHAYRAYTLRTHERAQRDGLAAHLTDHDIEPATYYTPPLHLQPAYRELGHAAGDFPVAESVSETMLSLPIHPSLTDEQVTWVIDAVTAFLR